MLSKLFRKAASAAFKPASAAPFPNVPFAGSPPFSGTPPFPDGAPSPGAGPATPFPSPVRDGRKLDITLTHRYLIPSSREPNILTSLWHRRLKHKISKSNYKKLPRTEKQRIYLASRPLKQKLLEWAGSKVRGVVLAARTVDAWSGPTARSDPWRRVRGGREGEVRLLSSGVARDEVNAISERAKLVWLVGIVISLGGLFGWAVVEKTKAEGLEFEQERPKKRVAPLVQDPAERTPGIYVWGSNRY
jgi:hypothetical protein